MLLRMAGSAAMATSPGCRGCGEWSFTWRGHAMAAIAVPPILATLVGRIAVAVPARARPTFLELLLGAAATKSGHVTDAILSSGVSRGWTTYFWFLERGRWSWLQVWHALLGVLTTLFAPAVWHVVVDDSVVERLSTRAPGSMMHHNHTAKPNRPPFLPAAKPKRPPFLPTAKPNRPPFLHTAKPNRPPFLRGQGW